MIRDVPPKDTLAPNTPLKKIGITATMMSPIAPMKMMKFKIFARYSDVGFPGLIPGTNPPWRFILFAISTGLNVIDV